MQREKIESIVFVPLANIRSDRENLISVQFVEKYWFWLCFIICNFFGKIWWDFEVFKENRNRGKQRKTLEKSSFFFSYLIF